MTDATVSLQAENLSLELLPDCGGAIAALRLRTAASIVDQLRPAPPSGTATRTPLDMACYPLVPFSNRIKDGKFNFGGEQFHIKTNLPGHPHPLHGHGWLGPWQVVQQDTRSVLLEFRYAGADFPSAYLARQRFELDAQRLKVVLELCNTGPKPMPCGVGLHPFFPKPEGTRLQACLRSVWLATDDLIPVVRVDVPDRWDFSRSRVLGDVVLDHCFGGWDGQAIIEWPSRGLCLRLAATGPVQHAVIYVPAGQSYFCFEPVTNANDAFNLAEHGFDDVGLQVLQPSDTLVIGVSLEVETMAG